jgi:hypothetical protein
MVGGKKVVENGLGKKIDEVQPVDPSKRLKRDFKTVDKTLVEVKTLSIPNAAMAEKVADDIVAQFDHGIRNREFPEPRYFYPILLKTDNPEFRALLKKKMQDGINRLKADNLQPEGLEVDIRFYAFDATSDVDWIVKMLEPPAPGTADDLGKFLVEKLPAPLK